MEKFTQIIDNLETFMQDVRQLAYTFKQDESALECLTSAMEHLESCKKDLQEAKEILSLE